MLTAKDIRKKCDEEIKKLQEICNHPKYTWCEEAWAPAHFTGRRLKICDVCEKVLERKGGMAWKT